MFLVLTRNPRRVDELSLLARRIPTIETTYIEERSEENKNKIKFSLSHAQSLLAAPYSSPYFIYIYIYIYCKTRENFKFKFFKKKKRKGGKIVIDRNSPEKSRDFYRSRMTKQITPLESSRKI